MKISNLSKKIYGESGFNINLINNLSFELSGGAVVSILAPFGSGKTTLLKIMAGIADKTAGEVITAPHHQVIYIPSEPTSLPWFSVNENFNIVSDSKELKNEIIRLLGLEGYENHHPSNQSRGFRFLISVGMALLSGADLILIDDPFTGLSDIMKERVFKTLRKISELKNVTFLFATSNLYDSILLSDKIIIMKSSQLSIIGEIQISSKQERNLEFLKLPEIDNYRKQIVDAFNTTEQEKVINISF